MPETVPLEEVKKAQAPVFLRSRVLTIAGWTLLFFSLALLCLHVLWMWTRMGSSAPLVAFGLFMDALVGLGLIIAGNKIRRKQS